jgi:hypothetical protein
LHGWELELTAVKEIVGKNMKKEVMILILFRKFGFEINCWKRRERRKRKEGIEWEWDTRNWEQRPNLVVGSCSCLEHLPSSYDQMINQCNAKRSVSLSSVSLRVYFRLLKNQLMGLTKNQLMVK